MHWFRKKQGVKSQSKGNHQKQVQQPSPAKTVVIMQSQCLGMTVIEESQTDKTQELTVDEWIDILQSQKLDGFSYERIYFSFLKGIPNFLRLKIWLLLSSQNHARNFNYTSKMDAKRKSYEHMDELTVSVYERLCENEPLEKEMEQIEKDIKRSFSTEKERDRYLAPLLRKMLYASSNSGIEYTQGMNYILLNILIFSLESLGINEKNIDGLHTANERDIFVIYREIIIRMDEVFGQNNIFKVMGELEERITETVPQILFVIYKYGLDVFSAFSAFSQHYFSVMSYNDPPPVLCRLMLDLFFLTGQKSIHAIIVKMLQVTSKQLMKIKDTEQLQKFLKCDIYHEYYKVFMVERDTARSISDFGLCFFDTVERLNM